MPETNQFFIIWGSKMTAILRRITTALFLFLLSVGSFADDHMTEATPVGAVYWLEVNDPESFVTSLKKYWTSETGQANPGYAIVREVLSAGESDATHTVAVVYPSYDAWDEGNALNSKSEAAAAFQREVQKSVEVRRTGMFEFTGHSFGDAEIGNAPATTLLYELSVSDPGSYVDAFKEFTEAQPSASLAALYSLTATGDSGVTHVLTVSAGSLGSVMKNLRDDQSGEAFMAFQKKVSGVRKVTGTYMTRDIAVFGR